MSSDYEGPASWTQEDLEETMTDSATWTSMLGSIEADSRLDETLSYRSENVETIPVHQSRIDTPDSLQQLRTMAGGQAFPEMRPMMKRFLQESDNSVDMTRLSNPPTDSSFRQREGDFGRPQLLGESIATKQTYTMPESPKVDDAQDSHHHEIPLMPTSTWNRKILLAFFFGLAVIAMFLGGKPVDNTSIAVSDTPFELIGSYVWTLKEKMGLMRVEYDTEAVASALLDQMMSLQGAYLATRNHLSAPDNKLHYQPMWQYAVKVRAESNLPARDELARDLVRLGDVVSGLSEETAVFSAFYASEFSSIASEFEKLGNTLVLSETQKGPGFVAREPYDRKPVDISSAIRSFTFAVQHRLDGMQRHVEQALAPARQAVISSRTLIDTLSIDETRLRQELRGQPAWQSWGHSLKELLIGVEGPTVRQALLADLAVSKRTIESLYPLANALEETRSRLVVQKKSIEMFSAASSAFRVMPSGGLRTPHRSQMGEDHKARLVEVVSGFRKSLQDRSEGYLLAPRY